MKQVPGSDRKEGRNPSRKREWGRNTSTAGIGKSCLSPGVFPAEKNPVPEKRGGNDSNLSSKKKGGLESLNRKKKKGKGFADEGKKYLRKTRKNFKRGGKKGKFGKEGLIIAPARTGRGL